MHKIYRFVRRTTYFQLRNLIKWFRLHNVYLKISDPLLSEKACLAIIEGMYEDFENQVLRTTFSKDDVLLELGTGLGFNSIFCAKINQGRVVSFEGNAKLLPLINEHMAKNKVQFDVRNQILLSKEAAVQAISFNIAEEFWSSSAGNGASGKIRETVTVPTASMRDVLEEIQPTYLMVDIEGGEEELFLGSSFLPSSSIRKILLELHPDAIGESRCAEIIQFICAQGFSRGQNHAGGQVVYFYR